MKLLHAGLLLLPLAGLAGRACADRTTYCCADDAGHQVCSDMLPPQCYNKPYREINSRAMTVRKVEPPLTTEQRAKRDAEMEKKKEAERLAMEQKRKDTALLASYASEADIAYTRDRALAPHRDAIKELKARMDTARQRQKSLAKEAEFYQKKPMPPELQASIRDNESDQKAVQSLIESRLKEMATINARYDEDLRRYRELTNKSGMGYSAVAAPH